MPELNSLEHAVMEMLLRGDHPVLVALAHQWAQCTLESRRLSGVGFFATFHVPDSAPRVPGKQSFKLHDVAGELDGLQHGAGFVLFVEEGKLDFLEGYSYDEPWPERIEGFTLKYLIVDRFDGSWTSYRRGEDRDVGQLLKRLE